MKYRLFTFKDDKLLCWRLGAINRQHQLHFHKDVEVNGLLGIHKPPISRGMWAFPYPHYDLFFVWHQWERHLPKAYRETPDDPAEEWFEERDRLLKEIKIRFKPSKFWADRFYSHIFPNGRTDYNDWYYWDSVRDWGKVAQKTVRTFFRTNENEVYTINYSKDHLEIFVP